VEKTTICLGMMVKNEAHVMKRVLGSAKPYIDSWSIIDTGSTDGTQDVIRECLGDLPGELHQREWTGHFGNHRTEVFELAREHADYVLMLDADDIMLVQEYFEWGHLGAKGYMVKMDMGGTIWDRLALLRSDKPWKYYGPIHECAKCGVHGPLPPIDSVRLIAMPDGRRRLDEPVEKYNRDVETLLGEIAKQPNDTRSWFYLAQSYRDAHRPEEAIEAYRKRVELGGWPEEIWYSLYQIGVLHERIGKPEEAIRAYVEAYEARPQRAEPLTKAASLARRTKRYGLAWLFAQCAKDTPFPPDKLFVNQNTYMWQALYEYATASYYVQRYPEGLRAFKQLKSLAPPTEQAGIVKNLRYFEEKLAPVRRRIGRPSGRGGKKLVFTGPGRSGTGYISRLLTEAGILCGHEIVFGPYTTSIDWREFDADSSWLAVPWLSTLGADVLVVHLTRDFLPCAQSWAGVGQFDENAHPNHGPYLDAVERFAPGILQMDDRLARIASYWTIWNESAARRSNCHLRIEDVNEGSVSSILELAGHTVDPGALADAFLEIPSNYNTRGRDETITLADVEKVTPADIWERLQALRKEYHYV
jgi:tetratricopeptide (TPR) repeat protein